MGNYIIGSGIAGLVTAYYNPGFKIVGDDLGGQMVKRGLGPRILEVNENSKNLLEDLGYDLKSIEIKTAKIGYRYEGGTHDTITPEYRKEYYIKSRNIKNEDIDIPSSVMSDGKNKIEYYNIDWKDLVDKLSKEVEGQLIKGLVKKMDLNNKTFNINDNNTKFEFDKLISTIPAPAFCKLTNIKPESPFMADKKVFIIVSVGSVDIRDYDYIYYPEKEIGYHRITNVGRNRAAIEYTGNRFKSQNLVAKWRHIAISSKELPGAQIISGSMPEVPNVEFVGRFAEWNHDIKTDDIVERFRKEW